MKKYLSIAGVLIVVVSTAVATAGATQQDVTPCEQETITVVDSPEHVVHHEAVTHVVHHPAGTRVVHHEAETHVVHHPAETHVVHHDAVTETGPGQRFQYNPHGQPIGGSTPLNDPGHWNASNAAYTGEALGVVYYKGNGNGSWFYWSTATIVVEAAYDETVLDRAAYDETVVDKAAYDETVTETEPWDETVVDAESYDETVPAVTHEEPNSAYPCDEGPGDPGDPADPTKDPTDEPTVNGHNEESKKDRDKSGASSTSQSGSRDVVPVAVNSQQSGNLPHTS